VQILLVSLTIFLSFYSISFIFSGNNFTILAQSALETIKYRNMIIDLGDGVKTNAQLTIPAVGNGPFPGVLLVHGSGPVNMNETIGSVHIDNQTGTKIYPDARPFFQISEYLSERGFAVLKYDKRGIGENNTILDSNVWGNVTFNNLKQDAEKALDILIQQPEVDVNRITVLGHSEGTIITPWVAIDNPNKLKNIVLMGAIAQNLKKIAEFQVNVPILYAKEILDHNHNGLLSLKEANENPVFSTMIGNLTLLLAQNITNTANVTSATNTSVPTQQQQQLNPEYNTNKDVYISIDNELKPKLFEFFESQLVITPGKKCTITDMFCPIWVKSHYDVQQSTVDIIGNVSSSILILQGENDIQTPVQQAFLLQQKLTDVRHPDHIIITYPILGHLFYPSSKWETGIGPIQQYVLKDLYAWLESHSGFTPVSLP
jgi:uncharacterized protein